ncbi:hypothetical protein GONAM_02_02200 [Gordonia namibiensis NBRC 108229]|uniref:DUF2332 domain-containing protein n=1 Tax=Gordonia namibiensis NBRC 108229 TaxID=1208314 RepID=K6WXZ3_9ACTN|nr:DUF2332 family protein [Gordonia namibiensis]GAB98696.1 hypothetical protein GONAM_02_02200 [Gordonia namibiensis NBRC 108229]
MLRRSEDHAGRYAVLYPAIAEVARRLDAEYLGLIDVGRPLGLNLIVDRVGISYGGDQHLGDASSPVQVDCSVVGDGRVPRTPLPEVDVRMILDRAPLDVRDPGGRDRIRRAVADGSVLDAEIDLAKVISPERISGDPISVLPEAVTSVPDRALPVILTTWSLSRFPPERRRRFVHAMGETSAARKVAWVSVEGVGVAPTIPTLGDRPASGHSIIGVTVFEPSTTRLHSEVAGDALGRCWSRGKLLSWFV